MIRRSFFLLLFPLLVFLFNSAILASIHLGLFGGCSLRGGSTDWVLRDSGFYQLKFLFRFSQFFIYLISLSFHGPYLLSLESSIGALRCLVILSFKASIWDFRLLISAFMLLNFLASLESLFCLCLSCLLVRGASNSGFLTSVSCSCSSSQAGICGGRFGSQVDICGGRFGSK